MHKLMPLITVLCCACFSSDESDPSTSASNEDVAEELAVLDLDAEDDAEEVMPLTPSRSGSSSGSSSASASSSSSASHSSSTLTSRTIATPTSSQEATQTEPTTHASSASVSQTAKKAASSSSSTTRRRSSSRRSSAPAKTDLPNSLQAGVDRYGGQVRYCITAAKREDPATAGRLQLTVSVANGRVVKAAIDSNTTRNDGVADCISRKVRRWKFDPSVNLTQSWPFMIR